jgi:hypothetical protein
MEEERETEDCDHPEHRDRGEEGRREPARDQAPPLRAVVLGPHLLESLAQLGEFPVKALAGPLGGCCDVGRGRVAWIARSAHAPHASARVGTSCANP